MIGKTFSHYRIIEKLGEGGMGIVYKAEDLKLKRAVALKFLSVHLMHDEKAKERLIKEAQAAASLQHPNIAAVFDFIESGDDAIIVMEYIEGETLAKKIKQSTINPDQILDWVIQIADGITAAHEAGILHRDIKPENILITKDSVPKIMDFGVAKLRGAPTMTEPGTRIGTLYYAAPEMVLGETIDHRSDIFSFGIVLYELLTGLRPFRGDYDASVVYAIVNETPQSIIEICKDIPANLESSVEKMLEKKKDDRYSSMSEVLTDLQEIECELKPGAVIRASKRKIKSREQKSSALLQRAKKVNNRRILNSLFIIIIVSLVIIWFFKKQTKIQWAKDAAIPQIKQLIEDGDYETAFHVAQKAEKYNSNNPQFNKLWPRMSRVVSIHTVPPDAKVFIKEYEDIDGDWEYLGNTSIEGIKLPLSFFRWKIQKDGYETVKHAHPGMDGQISFHLDKVGTIPLGMVRVTGGKERIRIFGLNNLAKVQLNDFYIDRYEVTNKQYKQFMDSGGYQNRKYWKHEFIKDGQIVSWEEAMVDTIIPILKPVKQYIKI